MLFISFRKRTQLLRHRLCLFIITLEGCLLPLAIQMRSIVFVKLVLGVTLWTWLLYSKTGKQITGSANLRICSLSEHTRGGLVQLDFGHRQTGSATSMNWKIIWQLSLAPPREICWIRFRGGAADEASPPPP